jgi:hypothetical protein
MKQLALAGVAMAALSAPAPARPGRLSPRRRQRPEGADRRAQHRVRGVQGHARAAARGEGRRQPARAEAQAIKHVDESTSSRAQREDRRGGARLRRRRHRRPTNPEYVKGFKAYMRKGTEPTRAVMNAIDIGTPPTAAISRRSSGTARSPRSSSSCRRSAPTPR